MLGNRHQSVACDQKQKPHHGSPAPLCERGQRLSTQHLPAKQQTARG
jgi:hypothetical protein